MSQTLDEEILELCKKHPGLSQLYPTDYELVRGVVVFDTAYQASPRIQDWFEIEIIIPPDYPAVLPQVIELQGKIPDDYGHLNADGTFCLATPSAVGITFEKNPTLKGFVDSLVVPYLYSYCCFRDFAIYPFGERSHGLAGLVEHYCDLFDVEASPSLWDGIQRIAKYGYRGHHPCPCGSGKIVRKCHKNAAMQLGKDIAREALTEEIRSLKCAIEASR